VILWGYMKRDSQQSLMFIFVYLTTITIVIIVGALPTSAALTRTLVVGSVGTDVLELQKTLNTDIATQIATTGPGSPGQETQYFGSLTKNAVIRYQEKYRSDILTPIGLARGTGVVGPQTIAHIVATNAQKKQNTTYETINTLAKPITLPAVLPSAQQSTIARITSISPAEATNGDEITITGIGFTKKNNILIDLDNRDKYQNISSSDGGTKITFTLNTEVGKVMNKKKKELTQRQIDIWKENFPEFYMPIRVETEYGISNPTDIIYLID